MPKYAPDGRTDGDKIFSLAHRKFHLVPELVRNIPPHRTNPSRAGKCSLLRTYCAKFHRGNTATAQCLSLRFHVKRRNRGGEGEKRRELNLRVYEVRRPGAPPCTKRRNVAATGFNGENVQRFTVLSSRLVSSPYRTRVASRSGLLSTMSRGRIVNCDPGKWYSQPLAKRPLRQAKRIQTRAPKATFTSFFHVPVSVFVSG